MPRSESPSIAILLAIVLLSGAIVFGQQPNSSAREVKIVVTAIDKTGKQVDSLKSADIRVVEEGAPQSVTDFRRITDRNLSLAILIDTSISQEATLGGQQLAATLFLTSIVRPGRDQAAVATFTNTLAVEQGLTDDLERLRAAINRAKIVVPPGYVRGGIVVSPIPPGSGNLVGSTAIWDAIVAICNEVLSQANPQDRRAIVLLTDGQDTTSKAKKTAAIEAAVQENVAIYSIGIGDPKFNGVNKNGLRELSEPTGGRAFFPRTVGELTPLFTQIRDASRNHYVVSYQSVSGKPSRKVRVEIVNPSLKDVQLFYQKTVSSKP